MGFKEEPEMFEVTPNKATTRGGTIRAIKILNLSVHKS